MTWDHISSGLDGRESAFELHANGGIPSWRTRLRRHFADYNRLANGVLDFVDVDMPKVDMSSLSFVAQTQRRQVAVPETKADAAKNNGRAASKRKKASV
jgi:4-hydroxyphenylacetate 3-monooxygenase